MKNIQTKLISLCSGKLLTLQITEHECNYYQ